MGWLASTLGVAGLLSWVFLSWGAIPTTPRHLRYRGRHYAPHIYARGDVPRFTRHLLRQYTEPAALLTIRQQLFLIGTTLATVG